MNKIENCVFYIKIISTVDFRRTTEIDYNLVVTDGKSTYIIGKTKIFALKEAEEA
jgi:hypothetical protein